MMTIVQFQDAYFAQIYFSPFFDSHCSGVTPVSRLNTLCKCQTLIPICEAIVFTFISAPFRLFCLLDWDMEIVL